jgi:regulator of protease activity HflC (stomatin/prohibitin superfamily)
MFILAAILFAAAIVFFATCKIATQYERASVFRLGRYVRTAGPGLYFLIPFIEWKVKVDLRIETTAVEPQEAITPRQCAGEDQCCHMAAHRRSETRGDRSRQCWQ